jgi:hypothetical protein
MFCRYQRLSLSASIRRILRASRLLLHLLSPRRFQVFDQTVQLDLPRTMFTLQSSHRIHPCEPRADPKILGNPHYRQRLRIRFI